MALQKRKLVGRQNFVNKVVLSSLKYHEKIPGRSGEMLSVLFAPPLYLRGVKMKHFSSVFCILNFHFHPYT